MMQVRETGVVYRNPKPWLRAVHAWHPSLAVLDSGEWVCGFDLGQAAESLDYRTYVSRSTDEGKTWSEPVRLLGDLPERCTTHTLRLNRLRNGGLTACGARFFRDDPEEGLTNRENLGFVPLELLLLRSPDGGRTWGQPEVITPPLVVPAFEVCHAVSELSDGRWIWPTQTWPGWEGDVPNGMRAVAFVSRDRGGTWDEFLEIFNRWEEGICHFEVSVVELSSGKLLSVAWAYHVASGKTLPTPYAVSDDGVQFSTLRPTGFLGQTAKLAALPGERVLCVYRRVDQPGLWGEVAEIREGAWRKISDVCLWSGVPSGMEGKRNTSDELAALKFGFPSLVRLATGEIVVVFWCEEEGVQNIRWLRVGVE